MQLESNDKLICSNIMFVTQKLGKYDGKLKSFTVEDYNLVLNMQNDEEIFNSVFFNKERKISEMEIKKLSGKNEANNASACPRCGSARYNVDKQTRASDEARSFYIKCGVCGLTEME